MVAAERARKRRDLEMGSVFEELNRPAKKESLESDGVEEGEEDSEEEYEQGNVPMTAFNLKEERESGFFDDSGNFVWRRKDLDEEEEEDQWLVNTPVMNKPPTVNKRSHARHSKQFLIQEILQVLQESETVTSALIRLGKAKDKDRLDRLTDITTMVLEDMPDIYDASRHLIEMEISRERSCLMENMMWEYKPTCDSEQVHGPYAGTVLQEWRQKGFFKPESGVYLRRVGTAAPTHDSKRQKMDELEADFSDEDEWKPAGNVDFQKVFDH